MKTREEFGKPVGLTAKVVEDVESNLTILSMDFRIHLMYAYPQLNFTWIENAVGGGPIRRDQNFDI
ncbi:MAG: hypothetical protein ABJA70_21815 [Chryseolinea sp.]